MDDVAVTCHPIVTTFTNICLAFFFVCTTQYSRTSRDAHRGWAEISEKILADPPSIGFDPWITNLGAGKPQVGCLVFLSINKNNNAVIDAM